MIYTPHHYVMHSSTDNCYYLNLKSQYIHLDLSYFVYQQTRTVEKLQLIDLC